LPTECTTVDLPGIVGGGYGDFWRFRGRYRVVKGSRASKKSKTTALWIIVMMMLFPLANALIVRKVGATLRDSCFSDLQWAAARLHVSHLWDFTLSPLAARYRPTGQTIFFRGLDDPYKLSSISCPVGVLCWVWIEEAYEIDTLEDFNLIDDVIRGEMPAGYFKQLTLTFNPWSPTTWIKARFFDAPPSPNIFTLTTTYRCNEWLDDSDRERFEDMRINEPTRFRVAGDGDWGIDGGAVFEEWRDAPEHYKDRIGTHVIEPFEIPDDWRIYRGFDFGYARPFAVGWFAADHDGRLYHIAELYGCTSTPNEGVKWAPDQIFAEIARTEREHPLLCGKQIYGVADPSIWDASRGISVAEMGERQKVFFEPGDNKRIPGWMQLHYRLRFDAAGIPMLYVFRTCRGFIRTIPVLKYDTTHPEDIDTDMEDHIADMTRYVCMARPIAAPKAQEARQRPQNDPLDMYNKLDTGGEYAWYRRN
jgi:phage terminase large subunit